MTGVEMLNHMEDVGDMLDHLVTRLREDVVVCHEPYDHYYMADCFPEVFYQAMLANLPPMSYLAPFKHEDSVFEGKITRYRLYLGKHQGGNGFGDFAATPHSFQQFWAPIATSLRSPLLRDMIFDKLQDDLRARFGRGLPAIRKIPMNIEVFLMRDMPGYTIAPHPDYHTKVVTAQFYLPADDSLSHLGTTVYKKSGDTFEAVKQFEFLPNTGYAFAVTEDKSWHGVQRLTAEEKPRDSLIVAYKLR